MTDAVFGLLGVLVGGAITGWTTYALERRRERAAARVAARLVREDLLPGVLLLEDVLTGVDSERSADLSPPEVWQAERTRLALVMPYEDYGAAAQAVYRYRQLLRYLASRPRDQPISEHISERERSAMAVWAQDMAKGLHALLGVAKGAGRRAAVSRRPGPPAGGR